MRVGKQWSDGTWTYGTGQNSGRGTIFVKWDDSWIEDELIPGDNCFLLTGDEGLTDMQAAARMVLPTKKGDRK
jgi:hypothetical protein